MAAREKEVAVVQTTTHPGDPAGTKVKPYCPVTVEPIIFLLILAIALAFPLQQQYIYYKLGNDTLPSMSPCNVTASDPGNKENKKIRAETANWLTYIKLSYTLPSLVTVIVLGSVSDRLGRKVTLVGPIIGAGIWLLLSALVVYFGFPLSTFLAGSFVFGVMGGPTAAITGCLAYIADVTDEGRGRDVRLAIVGGAAGLALIVGTLVGGFWLKHLGPPLGFQEPSWFSVGVTAFCLFYAIFALKETRPNQSGSKICSLSHMAGMVNLFKQIRKPQRWIVGILLSVYFLGRGVSESVAGVRTVILLSPPYCWNPLLLAYGNAVSGATFIMSVLGIKILGRWLSPYGLMQVGLLSAISGMVLQAVAVYTPNRNVTFYMGMVISCLERMPYPVLQATLSKMIGRDDQGSLFALFGLLDNIQDLVFTPLLNTLYGATLSVLPGFMFLFCAGLFVVCVIMIGVLQWYDRSRGYDRFITQVINEDLGPT